MRLESKVKARGTVEGFLMIKGVDGAWKRRWFVVLGTKVSAYKSVEDKAPLKLINLEKAEAPEEDKAEGKLYCFQLRMADEAPLLFHAESQEGYEYWVTAFNLAISLDSQRRAALKKQRELEATEKLLQQREQERERLLREERERERDRKHLEEERRKREEEEQRLREEREEALRRLHAKRTNIVQEILWTEQSYVDTLKMVCDVFIKPLKEAADAGTPIVPERQIRVMFPEVQAILMVNVDLLGRLEERVQQWSPTQTIGDVFLGMVNSLRVYVGLVNGYNTAVETINKLQQESPQVKAFLDECKAKPECRMIGIAEHLLTPIQRVPRYVMLLADLLKNTDSEHPDYANLVQALEEMKKTADFINEMKRNADSRLRVIEILEEVKGIPEDIVRRNIFLLDTYPYCLISPFGCLIRDWWRHIGRSQWKLRSRSWKRSLLLLPRASISPETGSCGSTSSTICCLWQPTSQRRRFLISSSRPTALSSSPSSQGSQMKEVCHVFRVFHF